MSAQFDPGPAGSDLRPVEPEKLSTKSREHRHQEEPAPSDRATSLLTGFPRHKHKSLDSLGVGASRSPDADGRVGGKGVFAGGGTGRVSAKPVPERTPSVPTVGLIVKCEQGVGAEVEQARSVGAAARMRRTRWLGTGARDGVSAAAAGGAVEALHRGEREDRSGVGVPAARPI